MNNLFVSGQQSLHFIRRELEDVFDEFTPPRRMRREVERAFDQSTSPMWLWREMDQILDEFMSPPTLRRRVERVFSQVLSHRGIAGSRDGYFRGGDFRGGDFRTGDFHNTGFNGFNNPGFNSFNGGFNSFHNAGFNSFNNPGFNSFNGGFNSFNGGFGSQDFTPPLELVERDGDFLVRVDLPGVREQEVDTRISEDNVLTIRGERRDHETKRGFGFGLGSFGGFDEHRYGGSVFHPEYSEQNYGVFTRFVPLPRGIDASRIQALFRDGVLEIRIPKSDAARQRRVPIGREEVRPIFRTNGNGEHRPHVHVS